MTKEELEKEAEEINITYENNVFHCIKNGTKWISIDGEKWYGEEKRITELEAQIEKLIDFVLSKTECCDICPLTDTCINSEGTCPYAGILAKGEEEVTREWLMQFISKEIKEK